MGGDATFYILRALSWTGLVWDLKLPPQSAGASRAAAGRARVIERAAEQLAERFHPERIAHAIAQALHRDELAALQEALARAQHRASEAFAGLHRGPRCLAAKTLPPAPGRSLAKTPSLDEVVDRAHDLLGVP